jgi:hypothetical protein
MPPYQAPPYPAPVYGQSEGPFANASFTPPVFNPGQALVLWSGETVAANGISSQFCMHRHSIEATVLSVQLQFSGDPGVFQVDFQTSDVDDDRFYVTKASLSGGVNSAFVGRMEVTNVVAKFARLYMVSITNAVSVTGTIY